MKKIQKKIRKFFRTPLKDRRGMTLIEAMIGIALVSFVMISMYMILAQAVRLMADAKQQIGATALATEITEYYRNQSYENIVIIDPSVITNIERSDFTYQVETSVVLIDDPENGVNAEGDYKQIKILVTWISGDKEHEVFFVNNFSPTGIMHGAIFVNAYDGESYSALGGALVKLDEVGGPFTVSQLTGASNGNVLFWGLDENISEYQITISKDGYGTVITHDPASTSFDPIYKNIALIGGSDSALRYFPLRQTSDLTIKAIDEQGGDVSGIDIELVGGQKIGNDPDTYDFDDSGSSKETDSNGEITYQNSNNVDSKMSPGNYVIANIGSLSEDGYEFVGADDNRYPFNLAAGISDVLKLVFADELKNSLLVKVKDSSDGVSVKNAFVRAQNVALGYDETVTSDALGFAFFRFDDTGTFEELAADDYEVEVSADGYDNNQATVTVSAFTSEEISLVLVE